MTAVQIPTKCDYSNTQQIESTIVWNAHTIPQVYVVTTPTVNYLYADINRPFHKNTNVYSDSTFISLNSQLDLLFYWITSVEFYSSPERRVWKKIIFIINILT